MKSLPSEEEARVLARTLRPIDSRWLRQEPSKQRSWYRGSEHYFDLRFDVDALGTLVWFQLTLRARSITWDSADGRIVTGSTGELDVEDESQYPGSKVVREDREPDRALLAVGIAILVERSSEPRFEELAQLLRSA